MKINNFLSSLYQERSSNYFDETSQYIYYGFLVLSFLIIPNIICWTKNVKIKKILNPDINGSYCVISIYMLNVLVYSLGFLMVQNIVMSIMIIRNEPIEKNGIMYVLLYISFSI